jgi:hypothetical protein
MGEGRREKGGKNEERGGKRKRMKVRGGVRSWRRTQ